MIGVHCSHGLNRTAYFVCRYMIDELKIDPEEAVRRFETARGASIKQKDLVTDLLKRN